MTEDVTVTVNVNAQPLRAKLEEAIALLRQVRAADLSDACLVVDAESRILEVLEHTR